MIHFLLHPSLHLHLRSHLSALSFQIRFDFSNFPSMGLHVRSVPIVPFHTLIKNHGNPFNTWLMKNHGPSNNHKNDRQPHIQRNSHLISLFFFFFFFCSSFLLKVRPLTFLSSNGYRLSITVFSLKSSLFQSFSLCMCSALLFINIY